MTSPSVESKLKGTGNVIHGYAVGRSGQVVEMLKVQNVVQWLEQWAPPELAESWDRIGLQCGHGGQPVSGIMTALTLSEGVIDEAVRRGAELIVTHHPLIFEPLQSISPLTRTGSLLYKLIKHDIALAVAHTNLDKAVGGVNDGLAQRLGLRETIPLLAEKLRKPSQYKLVTFLPQESETAVRTALAEAGAGVIGNYTHCAFSQEGVGSFLPSDGANPYTGSVGQLARVEEIRLETVVDEINLKAVITALNESHPYEEVAVDIYPLQDADPPEVGLGRVGYLNEGMQSKLFIDHVKRSLDLPYCRLAGNVNVEVKRVAVVGGSGGGFVKQAHAAGADALVTGDVDYHDADEAAYWGILLVDAGHFGTEKHVPRDMADYFRRQAQSMDVPLDVHVFDESDLFISLE